MDRHTIEDSSSLPTAEEAHEAKVQAVDSLEDAASIHAGPRQRVTEITADPDLGLDPIATVLSSGKNETRGTISAATIAQLMGLATVTDLKLLSGKVDLTLAKVNAITVRLEKLMTVLNSAPTGSDLERIDVQIGALRTLIREVLTRMGATLNEADSSSTTAKLGKGQKGRTGSPGEERA